MLTESQVVNVPGNGGELRAQFLRERDDGARHRASLIDSLSRANLTVHSIKRQCQPPFLCAFKRFVRADSNPGSMSVSRWPWPQPSAWSQTKKCNRNCSTAARFICCAPTVRIPRLQIQGAQVSGCPHHRGTIFGSLEKSTPYLEPPSALGIKPYAPPLTSGQALLWRCSHPQGRGGGESLPGAGASGGPFALDL